MGKKNVEAKAFLDKLIGEPLTFGSMLSNRRTCDEQAQAAIAKKLEISRQSLCDIKKGRGPASPQNAAKWAKELGYSIEQFVALALQDKMNAAGLEFCVRLTKIQQK